MNENAPPGNGKPSLPGEGQDPKNKMNDLGQVVPDSAGNASPTSSLRVMIRRFVGTALTGLRYRLGWLEPFKCSRCGKLALDPIGWAGKRRPLCESCADGEKP
jgi:hypothetical protein